VEAVICDSPLVKEVCVVGKISQNGLMRGTEEVCAVVVPAEPIARRSMERSEIAEELKKEIGRLSQVLAPYKRPAKVYVRFEDLPKTTTRKIKRVDLLDWLESQEKVPAELRSLR
jgi:long-chain acyl-CoA synthetase